MAKIEFITPARDDEQPTSTEQIEVRVWGLGGEEHQIFSIAGGVNFNARANIWIEVIYSVNGVDFFRTRNFLNHSVATATLDGLTANFARFARGEHDRFGFSDMLPETAVHLVRNKYEHTKPDGEVKTHSNYELEIALDAASILARSGPGGRTLSLRLEYIEEEEGMQFMKELIEEVAAAYEGKLPDPASVELGKNEWQFAFDLNQKAYDDVSQVYQEDYFSNPLLTSVFDTWLGSLPSGGHVLDAGCGHGDPVITRLLEKGFRVTGVDLSPKMLERARAKFPSATFFNQTVRQIQSEAEYHGACSLSSLLYLDPIDLSHSLYRLHRALKTGGLLFLHAYDLHPDFRGDPYDIDINRWMWSWTYSLNDAVKILEEHGYFKVIQADDVTSAEYKQKRLDQRRENQKEQYEKFTRIAHGQPLGTPSLNVIPENLAYTYAIIARRI